MLLIFQEKGVTIKTGTVMSSNEAIKQAVLNKEAFPIIRHWYVSTPQSEAAIHCCGSTQGFLLTEAAGLTPT